VTQPAVTVFVRLKLRILGNNLRGSVRQVLTLVFGALYGLLFAFAGGALFVAMGAVHRSTAALVAGGAGSVIVLGWLLLPVLFFGVDETLDPARFALLPITRRRLAAGMGAAALIGIPPFATAIILLASAVGALLNSGPLAGLVGLIGAGLALLFCVVGSRALTSALATVLRTRRVRDLATVIIALLAASIGPIELGLQRAAGGAPVAAARSAVRVLGWTPLGAGFVAPYDLADGRAGIAVARLALVAVAVALCGWWWSTTLEDAMIGTTTGARPSTKAVRGGAVAALVPRWLRHGHITVFRTIVARETRYWLRHPRRRIAAITGFVGALTLPLVWQADSATAGRGGPPLAFSGSYASVVAASSMFQAFSFDGTAYATHLLTGVRGRTDVRARATAITLLMLPILVVVVVILAVLDHRVGRLPGSLAPLAATFGATIGAGSALSIDGAFPMPDNRNMFVANTGTGTTRALLLFLVIGTSVIASLPVYVATFFVGPAILLPFAVAWGLFLAYAGTALAGRRLDRRGPELLLAVTPRR
jgi:ABC-2 type transport system permease protein